MTTSIDFDQYWGVRLSGIQFDCKSMSIAFDLYWTVDSILHGRRLNFKGVSKCELAAGKIFASEVVELVSLEGRQEDGGWRITGELSNYEFMLVCADVEEERHGSSE